MDIHQYRVTVTFDVAATCKLPNLAATIQGTVLMPINEWAKDQPRAMVADVRTEVRELLRAEAGA